MREGSSAANVRRSALAIVLVLLSLIAHSAGAASLPGITAVLGGGLVAGALAWALAGRSRSISLLAVILFAGQLLMHASVVALGHHGVSYVPDQRMLLAHLIAAGIAAVLFAHGEQIAVAWARAAARLLGVPRLPVLAVPVCPVVQPRYRIRIVEDFLVSSCPRRGPPTLIGVPTFA